MIEMIGRW